MGRRHENPAGRPLSGPEHDGLVVYRPSDDGCRSTVRVTADDAEAISAEPSVAERHRIAEERGLRGRVPRARAVLVDPATGARRVSGDLGALPTGRYEAIIDGQRVEIDSEDVLIPTRSSPPTRGGLRFDYGAPANYLARARKQKAEAEANKTKRGRKKKGKASAKAKTPSCPPRAPGIRATFSSSAEAARVFYEGNTQFFDHVRDPYDGLRDVFDGIEVRVGKRHQKLGHTKKGQAILDASPAEAIRKTLQAIFGRTRSRRWDEVDWPLIERLGEALQPYFEPYGTAEPSRSGLYWRPYLGDLDADALAELDPDTLRELADCESRRELAAALESLRETYAANRSCLNPRLRRLVERRLQEWEIWRDDPGTIPVSACAPDPHTGGMTCDYPALFGELRELRAACEVGYTPQWATAHVREGAPGFPDLHGPLPQPVPNPDEPPPEAAAAAADDSDSEAPLRVVYSYEAGILICGDTYPHRQAIKSLRHKRFKFSRRLPDDCAWYVPRSRDRHASRALVEQIADELRKATGVAVDVDYTAVDPGALTSMDAREAAAADRAEARIDRLESRAQRKQAESDSAYTRSKALVDRIPFGQPILVDHYSAKRHRRDLEKFEKGQRKSFALQDEAKQLQRQAKASERTAAQRRDPNFAQRRIAELRTELRGLDVTLTGQMPEGWRGLIPEGPATGEYKMQLQVRRAEILDQLDYWQRLLEESGAKIWGPENFQPGDVLASRSGSFEIVVRVNKKSLSVDSPPHMWNLKKAYTDIRQAPVRGTPAWREAIEFYANWLETRQPQPRVFPKRAKLARGWLAAHDARVADDGAGRSSTTSESWDTEDFEPGDVVHDDAGQSAVVVEIKPHTLVVEAKNRDTGRMQRYRLSPSLVRGTLERGSQPWRDTLQAYLQDMPNTADHRARRATARGWLGLPEPVDTDPADVDPTDAYRKKLEAYLDALTEAEADALVRATTHGTVPDREVVQALAARKLFHPQLNLPTGLGRQIATMLRERGRNASETASPTRAQDIAAKLRDGEARALTRAHRLGRVGQVFGAFLRRALHERGLFDYESASLTPLGHEVAEALLRQHPELGEESTPANTRPPEPPGALRTLVGWPDADIARKDIAAALRKLLRHRHPEVAFSIRTPNYSMASTIEIHPKGERRRWTEAERAVLRAVFGPQLAVSGNDASISPWDRVHKGGSVLAEPYVEDFKALLAGKKPVSARPRASKAKATSASPEPRPREVASPKAALPSPPSPPSTTDMNQLSIWEVPVPNRKKNPGRPKAKSAAKTKSKAKPKPNPKTKSRAKPKAKAKPKTTKAGTKPRPRRRAPKENPSRSYHLVAAHQALEKAERMLALAEKAPKDSISQRSAAMQAHAEAVLAHQNAGFVLDAGPIAPSVRDNMAQTRRKAASVARQAQVIVGAEKRPRRRAQAPTPNPGRRRTAASTSSSAAERARRALRSL
ncbi:MAG: DUF3560 domain-containing protein [Nannocystaceae bacterium]|nr:DUF3560 domain-containing protein [bacterium]